jgi:pimeloyl-ACP methyl ester carboxylesterase
VSTLFATWLVTGIGDAALRRRWRVLGSDGLVRETLRLCCTHPERVSVATRHQMETVAAHVYAEPAARAAYLEAVRSLLPLLGSMTRFGRLVEAVGVPTTVIHGADDRLVPLAAAEALAAHRSDWPLVVLPGVGHVPMLEAPELVAAEMLGWSASCSAVRAHG